MTATLHTMQDVAPAPAAAMSSTTASFLNTLPADLAELALLDIKAVSALVGLKSSAIFGRVRAGTFPEPVRMGAKCTRWTAGSIKAWLLEQIAGQPGEAQQRQQARAGKASSAGQVKRQAGARAAA